MDLPHPNIRAQFVEKLLHYLENQNESALADAYELGRSAVREGLGGVELVNVYHDALMEINSGTINRIQRENLKAAYTFLSECLAPYELRHRGFQDLIQKQVEKNKQLQNEIKRRKRSEHELKRSKEHFQHLIENALDIITVLNRDATYHFISPSVERILGYSPEELIGKLAFDYIHPDDLDNVRKTLAGILDSPGKMDSAEFRFKHKDGTWVYLESMSKNVMNENSEADIIVNSRDISERVKAWEKLKQSEKQLSTAQQIGQLGSWEWHVRENKLNWSAELSKIFGLPAGSYPNTFKEYLLLIHPDDRKRVEKQIRQAFEEKRNFDFEHKVISRDGGVLHLSCRGEVVTDSQGHVIKMIGTGQDITYIKQAEDQLRRYSKELRNLTAKQEKVREEERIRIAREIHDELGQMLTVLKMDISMVVKKSKRKFGDKVESHFSKEIHKIAERIDTIIHSVQRIASELRPEVLDDLGLIEALEWHAHEFEERTGIDLEFDQRVSRSTIDRLDEERTTAVFRIFQETLTNVIRHADASKVHVILKDEGPFLILKVKDNGKGISRKEIENSDSLGIIGMRERSNLLGGNIRFESEPGKGTTVTLKIEITGT